MKLTRGRELDVLFQAAVAAVDAGDVAELERQLAAHPALVRERLKSPGRWLRDQVGQALKTFFKDPYLLWFVAEDPVRNNKLPPNIADVARTITAAARREQVESLQEQLDYALTLVSWSWIARECGVQIALIDVLIDAGASPHGNPDNALVNGNVEAAEHLVRRGATLTLATALGLKRWDDARRLAASANKRDKQMAFVLAALRGNADALRVMLETGVDVNAPSRDLHSHGTPLHHAAYSGSLEAVKVLVEAGANLKAKDKIYKATPLGWAEHARDEHGNDARPNPYPDIVEYLRQGQQNARSTLE